MYHNKSFFIDSQKRAVKPFAPTLISAYKIVTDSSYFHTCDRKEITQYPKNTLAFIRCITGKGKIYTSHGKIEINESDALLLRFEDILKYKAESPIWSYRWTNFCADFCDFEFNKCKQYPIIEHEEKIFDNILLYGNSEIDNSYTNALFVEYYFSVTAKNTLDSITTQTEVKNRQVDDMCAFISQKVYSKLTVDELSAFFQITPRRLHQIFSSELGISPKQYILKKKMEEGYRLIVQTSMPICKISDLLCFSSQYHFTYDYKKFFNQTPMQTRSFESSLNEKA